ncbi:MAG: ribose-phosphate diphosphokinase [Mycoplasma sp.]
MKKDALIIGLSRSAKLAELVSKKTDIKLAKYEEHHFADGEILFASEDMVRGNNIYLIQSTCKPVNDSIMELFIAIDSLKRASARSISVIMPYYGYARQDRKSKGREPITSRLIADLLVTAGATRVLTLDIHSQQQQGFFSIPFDSLTATWTILEDLFTEVKVQKDETIVVSPDYGGVKRARNIADRLSIPLAIVDKRRPRPNEVEIENILGDVKGKHCIVPDDMIDTGGTMISVARLLKKEGAKSVHIMATHGLFNGNSVANFNKAMDEKIIDNLYISNSIETVEIPNNTRVVDISDVISSAIEVFETGTGSISQIYCKYKHAGFAKK